MKVHDERNGSSWVNIDLRKCKKVNSSGWINGVKETVFETPEGLKLIVEDSMIQGQPKKSARIPEHLNE